MGPLNLTAGCCWVSERFKGEEIHEPVVQHVVVIHMSVEVDSPGDAWNAKAVSGLLPRQQAMPAEERCSERERKKKDEEP